MDHVDPRRQYRPPKEDRKLRKELRAVTSTPCTRRQEQWPRCTRLIRRRYRTMALDWTPQRPAATSATSIWERALVPHHRRRQGVWRNRQAPGRTPTWTCGGKARSPLEKPTQPAWVGRGLCLETHQEASDAELHAIPMARRKQRGGRAAVPTDSTAAMRRITTDAKDLTTRSSTWSARFMVEAAQQ